MKDQTVGNQMVVLDEFALLLPIVLGEQCAVTTKRQPFCELIEGLAFGRRRVNGATQLRIAQVGVPLSMEPKRTLSQAPATRQLL